MRDCLRVVGLALHFRARSESAPLHLFPRLVYGLAAIILLVAAGCSNQETLSTPAPTQLAAALPTPAPTLELKPTLALVATPTRIIIRYRREPTETPSPVRTQRARTQSMDKMQVKAILPLKYVQFFADSAILTDKARKDVKEQVLPVLLAEDGTFLRIEGRAAKPPDQSDEACMKLSVERANAVAEYLVGLGVPRERVFARGVGAQKAQFRDSAKEEELAQDRIIEFAIVIPMG